MDDVFGQEKDVMELTTAETTLMKPIAVCFTSQYAEYYIRRLPG